MNAEWIISRSDWPPRATLGGPLSPSVYNDLSACPLRLIFIRDPRYPRSVSPATRIGIAFHEAARQIDPAVRENPDARSAAIRLAEAFRTAIAKQKRLSQERFRERGLVWPQSRCETAESVLMLQAHRFHRLIWAHPAGQDVHSFVELPLSSADGFLKGIIDRVEVCGADALLIDFKTGLPEPRDTVRKHREQLMMYAFLWFQNRGTWPSKAQILYPLARAQIDVWIDPNECFELVRSLRSGLAEVIGRRPTELAQPGQACVFCDFRPWCAPFWQHQSLSRPVDQEFEQARVGIGTIVEVAEDAEGYRRLRVQWLSRRLDIVVPLERFPHAAYIQVGEAIRVLDVRIEGNINYPRCLLTERSELWRVK